MKDLTELTADELKAYFVDVLLPSAEAAGVAHCLRSIDKDNPQDIVTLAAIMYEFNACYANA
jgi:hypothetical protein